LLLAAVYQTGLLTSLEIALSPNLLTADPSLRLVRSLPGTLRCQLLTLLFLEAVGLRRTWDLRGYTGQALALLTGRRRAYGYRHTERFLAELACVGAARSLTEALARWTLHCGSKDHKAERTLLPSFTSMGTASPSMPMR